MIHDLDQAQAPSDTLTADACIVGAGPAGISLALTLARQRPDWHIVLLEAGGFENATDQEKDIYTVELGEKSYPVLDISRRRKFGGTSTHWGGWCKPLDATDYEDNTTWDAPAWPINAETLSPYLKDSLRWVEIESEDFNIENVRNNHADKLLNLPHESNIRESVFRFSPPTRFGDRYRQDIASQENLTCLTHANLYELVTSADRITSAKARSLSGEQVNITATHFVLALGGMETTRQLLNLRKNDHEDGTGLHSWHLGRYFADHYGLRPGLVLAPENLQYHRFSDSSGAVMPVLNFSEYAIRTQGYNNSCMMLSAVNAENSLLNGYGGHTGLGFSADSYWHYRVQMIIEPRPNPESRLTLIQERCELGLRRMKLDWRPHASDFTAGYALYQTLGEALSITGKGRWQLANPDSKEVRSNVNGACHHLGTTRMAKNPEDGVVDNNLKVFDSENLYVASSSVFPRYGHANPTLTLIALSLRLAHHLSEKQPEETA
ncbi:MAG TPA: GMC family oxidoreductase [Cellvibrionaceae bacterium]